MNFGAPSGLLNDLCLLVEDHPMYGAYLEGMLAQTFPELEVRIARSVADTETILRGLAAEPSRIRIRYALIDIGLPDGSGIDLIRSIHAMDPSIRTIITSVFMEDSYIFRAMSVGAYGYILKNESREVFRETLMRLARDEPPLSPRIARRLLSHFHLMNRDEPSSIVLTPREKQTLSFLVEGMTVPEAARAMGISAQTVSGYVKIIYQKLHVSNRAEVTREALRQGLV